MVIAFPEYTNIRRDYKEKGKITSIYFGEIRKENLTGGIKPLSISVERVKGQPTDTFIIDAELINLREAKTISDGLASAGIAPIINTENKTNVTVNVKRIEDVEKATKAMLCISLRSPLPPAFRESLNLFSSKSKNI